MTGVVRDGECVGGVRVSRGNDPMIIKLHLSTDTRCPDEANI